MIRSKDVPLLRLLIGLNAVVFLLWFAGKEPSSPLHDVMIQNFLVSREHLRLGHYWTLVTSAFSQMEIWHLAFNMMVLYSFGAILVARWGQGRFLVFYLSAAVVASAGHVLVGLLLGRDVPALGASGAVSATLAAFTVFHPRHRILVFGVVPMPAWVGTMLFVGFDIWGLIAQSSGGGLSIGHGAHLAGSAFGFAYAWMLPGPRAEVLPPDHEVMALLAKVRAEGLEALSPSERELLERLLRQARGG